jgi:hypothetical protein
MRNRASAGEGQEKMENLVYWWLGVWSQIWAFLNTVFFSSIVGAAAGAYAGAYGAQRIAERTKYREQLLKELRDTNAATNLTFGICNSLLAMKRQHIKALKENFDTQKAAILEHLRKLRAGEIPRGTEFEYVADLQTLSLPPLPIGILQQQSFEKLSLVGRPLTLTTTLGQTLHGLSASLEKRNKLIATYKASSMPVSPPIYFGFPHGDTVNLDYPSTVEAIYRQTDDGIFFSHLLNKDLTAHGNQLAERFKKLFGKGAPPVTECDFSQPEQSGLMPDPKNYPDWFNAFKKKES